MIKEELLKCLKKYIQEISKCLSITYSSVSRIIDQSQNGTLKSGKRGGAMNVKLTSEASKIINDSTIKNPIITISKLAKLLN